MKIRYLLISSTLVLAACGQTDSAPETTDSTTGTGEPTVVRVLTHDSFSLSEELIAQFEAGGYELQTISPGDGGTVLNQLVLSKDNPQADAVYGIDTYIAGATVEEGVLEDYVSDKLPESGKQYLLGDSLTPIDMGDICINADLAWFENEGMDLPTSLEDLATPEYADKLVLTDPVTSSTGFSFLAATATSMEDWEGYWADLVANNVRISSSWSDAYYSDFSGSDGEGPYPLVLSYSSSPSAEVSDGVARTAIIDATCTRTVEYAGVAKGAANVEGAKAFVDFMLSDDVQASLPEAMYMYPINDAIELPAEWAENGPLATDPIIVDPMKVDRTAWLDGVSSIIE